MKESTKYKIRKGFHVAGLAVLTVGEKVEGGVRAANKYLNERDTRNAERDRRELEHLKVRLDREKTRLEIEKARKKLRGSGSHWIWE